MALALLESNLDVPPLADGRTRWRKRVFLAGVLVHDAGRHSFPCTIRDVADSSARISIPPRYLLPGELYLIKVKAGTAHHARLVWSREKEAGLRLLDSFDLAAPGEPGMDPLRDIWTAHCPR